MLRVISRKISTVKKIKWTGTTGGEVLRPHAEAEEKDTIEKDKYIKKN